MHNKRHLFLQQNLTVYLKKQNIDMLTLNTIKSQNLNSIKHLGLVFP